MKFTFNHTNLNVADLDRSVTFYADALGLTMARQRIAEDGSFKLAFLTDGTSGFLLELTWLREHAHPYELGENESHLCYVTDDYEAAHAKHVEMGCVCYENASMGLYFIEDPDGYWIEIVPEKRERAQ